MKTELGIDTESGRLGPPISGKGISGDFLLLCPLTARSLALIVADANAWAAERSDLPAWEHVSVSTKGRCPTWAEMCWVRDLFWGPEEWVVQYHPAHSEYVNIHPYTLHLWRPVGVEFPRPPRECV